MCSIQASAPGLPGEPPRFSPGHLNGLNKWTHERLKRTESTRPANPFSYTITPQGANPPVQGTCNHPVTGALIGAAGPLPVLCARYQEGTTRVMTTRVAEPAYTHSNHTFQGPSPVRTTNTTYHYYFASHAWSWRPPLECIRAKQRGRTGTQRRRHKRCARDCFYACHCPSRLLPWPASFPVGLATRVRLMAARPSPPPPILSSVAPRTLRWAR